MWTPKDSPSPPPTPERFRSWKANMVWMSPLCVLVVMAALAMAVVLSETMDIADDLFKINLWGGVQASMGSQAGPTRFRKIQSFQVDYATANITQYESGRSGMQVIVTDRPGPKVNGYFTLATEIFDDSGAPHTLEHLVFMGSRSYRYKGLLDKVASRAYGNTNAWTATDHTAYTLETAGWEGFAQTLPLYLEHIVLPNMTDAACLTEVHHIDGQGNDAGVVYSEMQGVQYMSNELMDIKARQLLYPENVGFRYETGGMMEALRVLTPKRIRDFHKAMYQPRNMCIVISGEVDHENLMQVLEKFEDSIQNDIPSLDTPFKRPWVDSPQPPALNQTVVETIEFPEEDESIGDMVIAFFGPPCTDLVGSTAMSTLLTYMCGSSVSVLENTIVEKEGLASSVSYWQDSRPNSVVWFQPTGVATEKLALVEQRLIALLKEVASKPLDMTYLKECLQRELRQVKAQAEDNESFYSTNIITDFLFGARNGTTLKTLQGLGEYKVLETWTDKQWRDFLKKWMSDAHHIAVLAKPSVEMSKRLKKEEKERVEKRKQELGPEGLKQCQEKLDAAKKENEVSIPESMLEQWPVPSTDSIHFIQSTTARSGAARQLGAPQNKAQEVIDAAKPGYPIFVQYESAQTNFVHIVVHVGTSVLPVHLKPLYVIFGDNFFNTPVERNGKRIEFEEMVRELEKDTVSYSFESGSCLGDTESFVIKMQVELEKYEAAIQWLKTLMFDAIFDVSRIQTAVAKQLADVPEAKRSGKQMTSDVELAIHNEASSLMVAKRTLVKSVYLRKLKKLLQTEPDTVISWLKELRNTFFTFSNVRVLVTADVNKLPDPVKTWDPLSEALGPEKFEEVKMQPIVKPPTLLNQEGREPGQVGAVIVPMSTIDSSFSVSTAKGLTSYLDPRVPALMVAKAYLESVEGPLWNAVRGNGLAYGVYFSQEIDGGYNHFRVYRSPQASKSTIAARDAIAVIASGEVPLEKPMVEGAISQIVMLLADSQSTTAAAAAKNYELGVIRGIDADNFNEDLLAKVRGVSDEEIRKVMTDLLLPNFTPGKSNVVVCCAPLMVETLEKEFKEMGYKTQVKQLDDYSDSYGLDVELGEGEGEEEDELESGSGSGSEGSEDDESGSG